MKKFFFLFLVIALFFLFIANKQLSAAFTNIGISGDFNSWADPSGVYLFANQGSGDWFTILASPANTDGNDAMKFKIDWGVGWQWRGDGGLVTKDQTSSEDAAFDIPNYSGGTNITLSLTTGGYYYLYVDDDGADGLWYTGPGRVRCDGNKWNSAASENQKEWTTNSLVGTDNSVSLYTYWDTNFLYIGIQGIDLAGTGGDFFVAIDTDGFNGGSYQSSVWDNRTHYMPFKADYILCIDNGSYQAVRKWTGSSWNDPGNGNGFGTGGGYYTASSFNEYKIKWDALGGKSSITTLGIMAWHQNNESNNNAVSASFPAENPARGADTEVFSNYYYWAGSKLTGSNPNPVSDSTIVTRGIVINEVNYRSWDGTNEIDDWVELYNKTTNSINLQNWCLVDQESNTKAILPSYTLNSQSYVVVHFDTGQNGWTDTNGVTHLYYDAGGKNWFNVGNNYDGALGLYNSATINETTIVDFAMWNNSTSGWSTTIDSYAVAAKIWTNDTTVKITNTRIQNAIYRTTDGNDNDIVTDWTQATGTDGRDQTSPGKPNSTASFITQTARIIRLYQSDWSTALTQISINDTIYAQVDNGAGYSTTKFDQASVILWTTSNETIVLHIVETAINSSKLQGKCSTGSNISSSGGQYLKVTAGDTVYARYCGLTYDSAQIKVISTDSTKPTYTINTPDNQYYGTNPTLDVDFSDNISLDTVYYQCDTYTGTWKNITSDGSTTIGTNINNPSWTTNFKMQTADWSGLSVGSHTIYFKAVDKSANDTGTTAATAKGLTIIKETTAPVITINDDSYTMKCTGSTYGALFDVDFSDNVGIDTIYAWIGTNTDVISTYGGASWTTNWAISNTLFNALSAGNNAVNVTVVDSAGNSTTSSIKIAKELISFDGDLSDWQKDEWVDTHSASSVKFLYSWDDTNIYIGVDGVDLYDAGSATGGPRDYHHTIWIAFDTTCNSLGADSIPNGTPPGENMGGVTFSAPFKPDYALRIGNTSANTWEIVKIVWTGTTWSWSDIGSYCSSFLAYDDSHKITELHIPRSLFGTDLLKNKSVGICMWVNDPYANGSTGYVYAVSPLTNNVGNAPVLQSDSYYFSATWDTLAPTSINIAPLTPTVSSPTGGAAINSVTPTFSWTFRDVADVQGWYQIQVDTAGRDFSSPAWDSNKTASSSSSIVCGVNLRRWTNYIWRVRVWDDQNEPSGWTSGSDSFWVNRIILDSDTSDWFGTTSADADKNSFPSILTTVDTQHGIATSGGKFFWHDAWYLTGLDAKGDPSLQSTDYMLYGQYHDLKYFSMCMDTNNIYFYTEFYNIVNDAAKDIMIQVGIDIANSSATDSTIYFKGSGTAAKDVKVTEENKFEYIIEWYNNSGKSYVLKPKSPFSGTDWLDTDITSTGYSEYIGSPGFFEIAVPFQYIGGKALYFNRSASNPINIAVAVFNKDANDPAIPEDFNDIAVYGTNVPQAVDCISDLPFNFNGAQDPLKHEFGPTDQILGTYNILTTNETGNITSLTTVLSGKSIDGSMTDWNSTNERMEVSQGDTLYLSFGSDKIYVALEGFNFTGANRFSIMFDTTSYLGSSVGVGGPKFDTSFTPDFYAVVEDYNNAFYYKWTGASWSSATNFMENVEFYINKSDSTLEMAIPRDILGLSIFTNQLKVMALTSTGANVYGCWPVTNPTGSDSSTLTFIGAYYYSLTTPGYKTNEAVDTNSPPLFSFIGPPAPTYDSNSDSTDADTSTWYDSSLLSDSFTLIYNSTDSTSGIADSSVYFWWTSTTASDNKNTSVVTPTSSPATIKFNIKGDTNGIITLVGRARNNYGLLTYDTMIFGFDKVNPTLPTKTTPTNQSETCGTTSIIRFDWTDSADTAAGNWGSGVAKYYIQIDTSSSFTAPCLSGFTASTGSETTYNFLNLPETIYYWRVYAKDNVGNTSGWTAADTFFYRIAPVALYGVYDAKGDTLKLVFSKTIKYSTIDLTKIKIDYNNDGVADLTLGGDNIKSLDSSAIYIKLTPSNAAAIEGWTYSQWQQMDLMMSANAVYDLYGAGIAAFDYTSDTKVGIVNNTLVINEICYDPPGTETNDEWVEIYNPLSVTVKIDGYRVKSINDNSPNWLIPNGNFSILPGKSVVLAADASSFRTVYGYEPNFAATGGGPDTDLGAIGNGLANDYDTVVLLNSNGDTIDFVRWFSGETAKQYFAPDVTSQSIRRKTAGDEGDELREWYQSVPGDTGITERLDLLWEGSGGAGNPDTSGISIDTSAFGWVVINEINYNDYNYNNQDADEWVEIYNKSDTLSFNLKNFLLTNYTASHDYTFDEITLPPRCFIVVHYVTGADETDFSDSMANVYTGDIDVFTTADECGLYLSTGKSSSTIIDFIAWKNGGTIEDITADNDAVAAGIWTDNAAYNNSSTNTGKSIFRKYDGVDNNTTTDWTELAKSGCESEYNYSEGASNGSNLSDTLPAAPYTLDIVSSTTNPNGDTAAVGDTFLIRVTATDKDSTKRNSINVRIYSSISDTVGIYMSLIETTQNSGIYERNATIKAVTNDGMGWIAAGNGETIDVYLLKDTTKKDTISLIVTGTGINAVVINEISNSYDTSQAQEFIELYNTSGNIVTIGGCYLHSNSYEYMIPAGTQINPNSYYAVSRDVSGISITTSSENIKLLNTDNATPIDLVTITLSQESYWIRLPDGGSSTYTKTNPNLNTETGPTKGYTNYGAPIASLTLSVDSNYFISNTNITLKIVAYNTYGDTLKNFHDTANMSCTISYGTINGFDTEFYMGVMNDSFTVTGAGTAVITVKYGAISGTASVNVIGRTPNIEIKIPADNHDTIIQTITISGTSAYSFSGDTIFIFVNSIKWNTIPVTAADSIWTGTAVLTGLGDSVWVMFERKGDSAVAFDTITVNYFTTPTIEITYPDSTEHDTNTQIIFISGTTNNTRSNDTVIIYTNSSINTTVYLTTMNGTFSGTAALTGISDSVWVKLIDNFGRYAYDTITVNYYHGPKWYVDDTGFDTYCGSQYRPFRTITKAMNIVSTGETVSVYPGLYAETVVIGTDSIYLTGADSASVILNPPGDSTITNLYGIYADTRTNLNIKNLRITDCYYGIYFYNVDTSVVDNVTIDSTYTGIYTNTTSESNTYSNCYIHRNYNGFYFAYSNKNYVANCLFQYQINAGIILVSATDNRIYNNISSYNAGAGFYLDSSSNNSVINNISQNNAYYGYNLLGADNNRFTGNVSKNNNTVNGYGYYLNNSSNNYFSQNTADSNQVFGFYIKGTSASDTFAKNNWSGSTTNPDSAVYNEVNNSFDFRYNYWSTTDSSVINNRIKGPSANKVIWTPFRTSLIDTSTNADTIAPATPVFFNADTSVVEQVILKWVKPSIDENGFALGTSDSDLYGYRLYRAKSSELSQSDTTNWESYLITTITDKNDTDFIDTPVVASETYYYRIVSFDSHLTNGGNFQNRSWYSTSYMVQTKPANTAPSCTITVPGAGETYGQNVSCTVVISDPNDNYCTFTIIQYSKNGGVSWVDATISGNTGNIKADSTGKSCTFVWNSAVDLPDTILNTVRLRVRLWDGIDTSSGDTTGNFGIDNLKPDTPVGLTASADLTLPDTGVLLNWNSVAGDTKGYNIYVDTSGVGNWIKINNSVILTNTYFDTNVSQGETYYFSITCVDSFGNESGKSDSATAPNIVANKYIEDITINGISTELAKPGATMIYYISFTNNGFGPAHNLTIIETLPVSSSDYKMNSADTVSADGFTAVITYSNNNGASFGYTPAGTKVDGNVTNIRWVINQVVYPKKSGINGRVKVGVVVR